MDVVLSKLKCRVRTEELTQQVHSELVCSDVVKDGGEDGQQRHGHVVDALADALHLSTGLHELPQFQHLQQLLQVLRRVLEERPKADFDQFGAGLHHCSERRRERVRTPDWDMCPTCLTCILTWCPASE